MLSKRHSGKVTLSIHSHILGLKQQGQLRSHHLTLKSLFKFFLEGKTLVYEVFEVLFSFLGQNGPESVIHYQNH